MNKNLALEKYKSIYEIFDTLRKLAGIPEKDVDKCFTPNNRKTDKVSIFKQLCISLQNSGHMSNSIKFNDNNKLIKEITCKFNAMKVLNTYDNWDGVYKAITENGITDKNGQKEGCNTNWKKYARGIFEGAKFLAETDKSGKTGFKIIQGLVNKSVTINDISELIKEIKSISSRINGLGFALTCDWLKECGCTWLCKPDVHIVEVYKVLTRKKDKPSEEDIIKYFFKYANLIKKKNDPSMTAYKLDKIIWLICTGNFYQFNISIGRDLIIKKLKSI